jgi:hypothetical protein
MYQFVSGSFISGLFTSKNDLMKAGTPILLESTGDLETATAAIAIDGIMTTDADDGDYVGFQDKGFCRTSMIDGSGSAIAIGDTLEVGAAGKLVKVAIGVAVAVACTAVTTDMSTSTKDDAFQVGLTLPLIKLL